MVKILILIAAWTGIWAVTRLLPPISPGWLPFLPVLYPTYSLIIRRRNPGVRRSIVAMLTVLLIWIDFGWAMSYAPRASLRLLSLGVVERGQSIIEVGVYEGRCSVEHSAYDLQGHPVFRRYWRLPPVWTFFLAVGIYPAVVVWRHVPRRRDHVRDTCLLSMSAAILFVGILVQVVVWAPATYSASKTGDPVLDVLVLPPGFFYVGTVMGAIWFPMAVSSLRLRPLAPTARSILLTMSITAVICAVCVMLLLPTNEVLGILASLVLGSVVFLAACTILRRRLPILYPPGHCVRCGYNLTGNVSGVCPECGTPVPTRDDRHSERRDRP